MTCARQARSPASQRKYRAAAPCGSRPRVRRAPAIPWTRCCASPSARVRPAKRSCAARASRFGRCGDTMQVAAVRFGSEAAKFGLAAGDQIKAVYVPAARARSLLDDRASARPAWPDRAAAAPAACNAARTAGSARSLNGPLARTVALAWASLRLACRAASLFTAPPQGSVVETPDVRDDDCRKPAEAVMARRAEQAVAAVEALPAMSLPPQRPTRRCSR